MSPKKETKKQSDWELESSLDEGVTLDQLIDESPFKESSDEAGNSVTAGTRIPMWLKRRITKIREMSGTPYELDSDVIRDALYIGLRVLHIRYKTSPDWHTETRLAAAIDAVGASRRIRSQVNELVAGLEEMVNDKDKKKAAEHLTDFIDIAGDLEDGWHKEKLFKILNESKVVEELLEKCSPEIQDTIEKYSKSKRRKKSRGDDDE